MITGPHFSDDAKHHQTKRRATITWRQQQPNVCLRGNMWIILNLILLWSSSPDINLHNDWSYSLWHQWGNGTVCLRPPSASEWGRKPASEQNKSCFSSTVTLTCSFLQPEPVTVTEPVTEFSVNVNHTQLTCRDSKGQETSEETQRESQRRHFSLLLL